MWEPFLLITCQLRFSVIIGFVSLSLCEENSSCSSKILFLCNICAWYQLLGLETHFLAAPTTTCGHVTNFLPIKIQEEMICAIMDVALSESVYLLFPHPLMKIDIKAPGEAGSHMEELGATIFHVQEGFCWYRLFFISWVIKFCCISATVSWGPSVSTV